jgi:hypothetical protein
VELQNTALTILYVRESCHKGCRVIRMATASHLSCLGVFTYHGNIRVPGQWQMLVITSGIDCAVPDENHSCLHCHGAWHSE